MSLGEQNEKLSAAEMEHLRTIVDAYFGSDLERRIAERDAIDRRADFVGRLGAVGLALLGLAALAVVVGWATR